MSIDVKPTGEGSDVEQGSEMRRTVSIGDIIVPMNPLERFRHTAEKVILENRRLLKGDKFEDELKTNLDIVGSILEDVGETLQVLDDEESTEFTEKPITELYLAQEPRLFDSNDNDTLKEIEDIMASRETFENMIDLDEELEKYLKEQEAEQKAEQEAEQKAEQELQKTKSRKRGNFKKKMKIQY